MRNNHQHFILKTKKNEDKLRNTSIYYLYGKYPTPNIKKKKNILDDIIAINHITRAMLRGNLVLFY